MKILINLKHENFNDSNNLNDIALFKLNQTVNLNQNIQIACLPDPRFSKYPTQQNISAWINGWGSVTSSGTATFTLQNGLITVYNENFCNNVVVSYQKNWDAQICAGEIKGGVDSCQGDSGGGLFVQDMVNNKTKYIVSGIGIKFIFFKVF